MNETHAPDIQQMLAVTRMFWALPFTMAAQVTGLPENDEIYFTDAQVLGLSPLPARPAANATSGHSALHG
jgi:hypothetical protein